MIIHCLVYKDNFWCWGCTEKVDKKVLEIKKKDPKASFKKFDIDSITAKFMFNNSITEVKKYYKEKFKLN